MRKEVFCRTSLFLRWALLLSLLVVGGIHPVAAQNQTRTIKGRVLSGGSNQPVPGVSVSIRGESGGTSTSADGSFTLHVSKTAKTLVFSSVGFETQQVSVSDVVDVTLHPMAGALTEVVVVGYGTQKRQDVTSAVATVKPDEFNQDGARNALDLIQGKVAGVTITRTSGSDPNSSPSVQIRSATSLTGTNSPLIVIDGIPGGNLDLLQQDDIASFDILKDGSAAAIYGTQANGGVIIVTTKKGKPGPPHYDYSTYFSKEFVAYKPDFMTPDQYRAKVESGLYPQLTNTYISGIYNGNTNMFDSVVNHSNLSQYHNLSMSGGGANSSYRASVYYSVLEGLAKEDSRQQYGARFSITQRGLNNRLNAQVDFVTNFNKANLESNNLEGGSLWLNSLTRIPTLPIHDSTGAFLTLPLINNPVSDFAQETYLRDQETTSGDASLTLDIWKGIKAGVFGSIMRDSYVDNQYQDLNSDASLYQTYYPGGGYAYQGSSITSNYAFTPTVEYNHTIGGKHNISAVAGYNYQYEFTSTFSADNRSFINDVATDNNLGSGNGLSTPGGADESSNKYDDKLIAFFARANYNYLERYLFQVSLRREGSSKFGADHKWGYFPAASAGWDISREAFMHPVSWVNELKLRVGYGVTGNSGIPDYQSLVTLTTGGQYAYPNGTYMQTYGPGNNPNPNLKWERKAELNIGTDFSLFNNRLSGSIDGFYRKTTDLLYNYNAQLPPYVQSTIYTNVGSMSSKGIELGLSGVIIKQRDFTWRMDATFSTASNKMISLSNGVYQLSYFGLGGIPGYGALGNALRITQGGAIGNFYGKRYAGLDSSGHWLFYKADGKTKVPLTQVSDDDQTVIGNAIPKFYVSWTNSFTYKHWDLRIFFRGRFKYSILDAVALSYGNRTALPANVLNSAFTTYAKLNDTYAYSNYYLQPGGFFKLDNVTLGYTFKLRTDFFRSLRLYVNASNLAEITRYKGNDPDYIEDTGLTTGIDGSVVPSARQFLAGLNLGF